MATIPPPSRKYAVSATNATTGIIRPDELYTAAEVRKRLKLGSWQWRKLRERGFPLIRRGKTVLVYGADAIAYFRNGKSEGEQK